MDIRHCNNALKGSYNVAKKKIILWIGCNAMCLCVQNWGKKITLFYTYCTLLLLVYAPPYWNASIFIKLVILRSVVCSDLPAIWCVVIGQIPQACDGNVKPLPMVVMPCPSLFTVYGHGVTRLKPAINEAFVAFSEDIMTDYNDSYGLFMRCIAPYKHNTMSAFVIVETPNKHYSTLLKTHFWTISKVANSLNIKTY